MFDRLLTVFFSTKINNMGMTRCVTEVDTSLPSARAANSATHIMPMLKKLVRFQKDVFKISLLDALLFLLVSFLLIFTAILCV